MKELTIEQKAQRYDEAVKRAKIEKEKSRNLGLLEFIDENFPELKESEDERIRRCLIEGFSRYDCDLFNGLEIKNIISWLEKQVEHANFRNKIQIGDKVTRNEDGVLVNLSQLNRVAKKDEQKPAWSEEDETRLTNIIIMLKEGASLHFNKKDITKAVDFLKFLKERYTWKPSKEQIIALRWIMNNVPYGKHKEEISGLLDQIKEL